MRERVEPRVLRRVGRSLSMKLGFVLMSGDEP